ncbi:MAG: serine/threonine-protein phosphatase [Spirochaetia bacterium]|nr:serine/threonine-protein phosphatase [Spirochaetia bacterium]
MKFIQKNILILLPAVFFLWIFIFSLKNFDNFVEKTNPEFLVSPNKLILLPTSFNINKDIHYFHLAQNITSNETIWEIWLYAVTPFMGTLFLFCVTGVFIYLFARRRRLEKSFLILLYFFSVFYITFIDFMSEAKLLYLFYALLFGINIPLYYFCRSIYGLSTKPLFFYITIPLALLIPAGLMPESSDQEIILFLFAGFIFLMNNIYLLTLLIKDIKIPSTTSYIKQSWPRRFFSIITVASFIPIYFFFFYSPYKKPIINISYNALFFLPALMPVSFFALSQRFNFVYFETILYGWFTRFVYSIFFFFIYWFSIGFHIGKIHFYSDKQWLHIIIGIVFILIIDPLKTLFLFYYNSYRVNRRQGLDKYLLEISNHVNNPEQIGPFLEKFTSLLCESLKIKKVRFILSNNLFEFTSNARENVIFIDNDNSLWDQINLWKKARKYPTFTQSDYGPIRDLLQTHGGFLLIAFQKFQAGLILDNRETGEPILSEDIRFLKAVLKQTEPLLENYQYLAAGVKIKRQEKELELASRIQENFLPKAYQNKNVSFYSFFRPSNRVSGDYIDFLPISNNEYYLFLGDVSGHGLGSSYIMSIVRSIIRSAIYIYKSDIAAVFEQINDYLSEKYKGSNFMTLAGLKIQINKKEDKNEKIITYINAGQHPPLLYFKNKKKFKKLSKHQRVLGAVKTKYKKEKFHTIEPIRFIIYSDGAFEIFNKDGVILGQKKLNHWIKKNIHTSIEEQIDIITKKILSYSINPIDNFDDISFVALEIK